MLDDLLQEAKTTLADRLASPLIGGFVLSWCLWNWKFLIILFSDNTVSRTLSLVNTVAFPSISSVLTTGVLFPLFTTLAYVFLYPYPARFVYGFSLRQQRVNNSLRQRIADETLLSLEESRRLRAEFLERDKRNQEAIETLKERVTELTALVDLQVANDAPKPTTGAEKLYAKLEASQLDMLRRLESMGGKVLEADLVKSASTSKIQAQFDIGELRRRDLILSRIDARRGVSIIEFTHEGRRALLSQNGGADA